MRKAHVADDGIDDDNDDEMKIKKEMEKITVR